MTNKYFWKSLLVVALSTAAVSGQHASSSHLQIRVADQTGAVVPNARVEIAESVDRLAAVGRTDSKGIVTFDLPAGNYELMVVRRGFYFRPQRFELVGPEAQILSALLQVGSCPGPGHPACIEVEPLPESDSPTHSARRVAVSVTDSKGEPISGAVIEAFGMQTGFKANAKTDEFGLAELKLVPGSYIVSTAARFFKGSKAEAVIRDAPHQNIRVEMDVDCGRVICGSR